MSETLLKDLYRKKFFRCPSCTDNVLALEEHRLVCNGCGKIYPVVNGVVDFYAVFSEENAHCRFEIGDEIISKTLNTLDLPNTAELYQKVSEIYGRLHRKCKSAHLTAEIASIAERMGIPQENFGIQRNQSLPPLGGQINCAKGFFQTLVNFVRRPLSLASRLKRKQSFYFYKGYDIIYERHYIEDKLPPDTLIFRNVRVANLGSRTWCSTGADTIFLGHCWHDTQGNCISEVREGTPFPIDIETHRSITIPLRLRTPRKHGTYTLSIFLLSKDARRLSKDSLEIKLTIGDFKKLEFGSVRESSITYDYAKDHSIAFELLDHYVRDNIRSQVTVLEIGGGIHPQCAYIHQTNAVNLDISRPMLELGALFYAEHNKDNVLGICADANNPPFAKASFDGAVMFATLHHFPEPEKTLATLVSLVKDDGFIGVLCEPVSHSLDDELTKKELLKGINEQVFSIDEYLAIFSEAGLAPIFIRVDGGSLKSILKKQSG